MRRPYSRYSGMSRLGGIVNSSLDELGLRHRVLEYQAMDKWREVVGSHIAGSSIAERVRDGILFVCCKSSAWSSELTLHKEDIIKRLNKAVGKKVIKDIRFSARGFAKAKREADKEQVSNTEPKSFEKIEVNTEVADKIASNVASQELADKIRKAVITSKKLEELKKMEKNQDQ